MSVIGIYGIFGLFIRKGIKEPLDPKTLPYLTTENFVALFPAYEFPEIKSLSETSFVAPYKFIGY